MVPHKDSQVLIPGTCEYVVHSKRDFVEVTYTDIKTQDLWVRDTIYYS